VGLLKGGGSHHARGIAEIIQRTRPDVLLLNEFDYDAAGEAARIFCAEYLQIGQNGYSPVLYPYVFAGPVNTGVSSEVDLDGDGKIALPNDAHGFGRHPGQYGMLILSRYPIAADGVRTFQKFLWKDMPGAQWPKVPGTGASYYSEPAMSVLRLSSKSHWDIPVLIGAQTVHVLAAHPTPPAFDGPEDRNGHRNHDEVRFWADYVDPSKGGYVYDDQGARGGLAAGERFVVLGDYNADPSDGDSVGNAIDQLVRHPLINGSAVPVSRGAVESSERLGGKNLKHRGPAKADTAQFSADGSGNLRVDYALPSRTLSLVDTGVFWPMSGEDGAEVVKVSDHRLVWVDVKLNP